MSGVLRLTGVSKRFGSAVALAGLDLEVERGEFLTLLGPSGCGKTTLLRIIAGFEHPSAGRVELEDAEITRVPSHRRPVNTVFQRYLLFPHLDVFENVAFGLRVAGCPRRDLAPRVREALALVGLTEFEKRRADQLSGGQSQRVSLARALVNRPRILLLDEPLSALDLRVRLDMQTELRRIHRETGATFLYVTHDQQEAMSLSDRIAVLNSGRIEQIAPPEAVYHRPATVFVARFVGDANVLPVDVQARDGATTTVRIRGAGATFDVCRSPETDAGWIVLRPEVVRLEPAGGPGVPGRVADVAFLGSSASYRVDVGGVVIRAQELGSEIRARFAVGDAVCLGIDPERCMFLTDPDRLPANGAAALPGAVA